MLSRISVWQRHEILVLSIWDVICIIIALLLLKMIPLRHHLRTVLTQYFPTCKPPSSSVFPESSSCDPNLLTALSLCRSTSSSARRTSSITYSRTRSRNNRDPHDPLRLWGSSRRHASRSYSGSKGERALSNWSAPQRVLGGAITTAVTFVKNAPAAIRRPFSANVSPTNDSRSPPPILKRGRSRSGPASSTIFTLAAGRTKSRATRATTFEECGSISPSSPPSGSTANKRRPRLGPRQISTRCARFLSRKQSSRCTEQVSEKGGFGSISYNLPSESTASKMCPELRLQSDVRPAGGALASCAVNKVTACKCGQAGMHYSETMMVATFSDTPEKVYNLMFASDFSKDFMLEDQKLKDLQITLWDADPNTNLLSRRFSYIKMLNGIVKQTKCELNDETLHCDYDDYICTLTTTRTPDVPSGESFFVKTLTCIMWAGAATTKVIVTTQVEWTGRSFIKSLINCSAIDGQRTYHAALERAMRNHIAERNNRLIQDVTEDTTKQEAASSALLTENKRHEFKCNQRAMKWAFGKFIGMWKDVRRIVILSRHSYGREGSQHRLGVAGELART